MGDDRLTASYGRLAPADLEELLTAVDAAAGRPLPLVAVTIGATTWTFRGDRSGQQRDRARAALAGAGPHCRLD